MGRTADVVIVGAGIPGLALALELQQRKISTLLLDARKGVEAVPRGITLQPNGLGALDKLGVLERARQSGSQTRIFEIRGWDGELLLEADYGLLDHPHNYLLTVNASELALLLRYKAERSGAEVDWGARFHELIRNDGKVQGVSFEAEGGIDQVACSVVVGADGPQSQVRASMGAKVESRKYPDSFVVGLVGSVSGVEGRARQYQDPGKMLGIMPAGPEATYIFYSVGSRTFDEMKREGLEQFKAEISQVAPETSEAFASVAAWTKLAYFTPSYVKVDPWVGNGVALLGDSAHTFHPHAGQGLNLSLQDALVLADVIEKCIKSGDISANALEEYQTRQRMFAEVIGQHADYSARYALSSNWLVRILNRRALRKLQKNKKLLRQALELTAGVFDKKPGLVRLARIGGILP